MKFLLSSLSLIMSCFALSQELIINEISQGSGTAEYVEFVVGGQTTCELPVPCVDLRRIVFDDNNGSMGSSGIAQGAMRFANDPFWSCIEQGTIIVVYNSDNKNPAIGPDDMTMADNNFTLIIGSNSNLFERSEDLPTNTPPNTTNYPADNQWIAGGDWNTLGMRNDGDAFQIPVDSTGVNQEHVIAWGSNTANGQVLFNGSASGKVFSFVNTTDNNKRDRNNWSSGDVGVDETPGAPNSAENASWIASLSFGQGNLQPISVTANITHESCVNSCDGEIEVTVQGGYGGNTLSWSNTQTTSVIENLCPSDYTITITDAMGCQHTETYTVDPGVGTGDADFQVASALLVTDTAYTYVPATPGGTWVASCGECLSDDGVFDPAISGPGEFSICYEINNGICQDLVCRIQVVNSPCSDSTSTQLFFCDQEGVEVFGEVVYTEGTYSQSYITQSGCDSTSFVEVIKMNCSEYGVGLDPSVPNVLFPNVITANNDNINDAFILNMEKGNIINAVVLNRWGTSVFEFNKTHPAFIGQDDNGNELNDGVYYYNVLYMSSEGNQENKSGFLHLIRD